ncbi:hypothetical protein ABL78_0237 [Leptomonas seymouri]|uniref:Uncharacterized protein n=1 Tax=Leptomonas seymouri TaxID=5684 RepID=A0A0N1PEC6_LEPSE|nr:hypothetical protein ABL78_0237 [Leptomonas seymouri]|eukprot:KPI90641.1 hypothetical protein ABL78_0237 [Leptomonas seymouri]
MRPAEAPSGGEASASKLHIASAPTTSLDPASAPPVRPFSISLSSFVEDSTATATKEPAMPAHFMPLSLMQTSSKEHAGERSMTHSLTSKIKGVSQAPPRAVTASSTSRAPMEMNYANMRAGIPTETLLSPLSRLLRGAALHEDVDAPLLNIPEDYLRRVTPDVVRALGRSAKQGSTPSSALSACGESTWAENYRSRPYAGGNHSRGERGTSMANASDTASPSSKVENLARRHRSFKRVTTTEASTSPATRPRTSLVETPSMLEARRAVAATLMVDPDAPRPSRAQLLTLISHAAVPASSPATKNATANSPTKTLEEEEEQESTQKAAARTPVFFHQSGLVDHALPPFWGESSLSLAGHSMATPSSSALAAQASGATPPLISCATAVPMLMSTGPLRPGSLMGSFTRATLDSLAPAGASTATASACNAAAPPAAGVTTVDSVSTSSSLQKSPICSRPQRADSSSSAGSRPSAGTSILIMPYSPLCLDLGLPLGRGLTPFADSSPLMLDVTSNSLMHSQDPLGRCSPTSNRRYPLRESPHHSQSQKLQRHSSLPYLEHARLVSSATSGLTSGDHIDAPLHFEDFLDDKTGSSIREGAVREFGTGTVTDIEVGENNSSGVEDSVPKQMRSQCNCKPLTVSSSPCASRLVRSRGDGVGCTTAAHASCVQPVHPPPLSTAQGSLRAAEDGATADTGSIDNAQGSGLHGVEKSRSSLEREAASSGIGVTKAAATRSNAMSRARSFRSSHSSTVLHPTTMDSASTSSSSQALQMLVVAGLETPSGLLPSGRRSTGTPSAFVHSAEPAAEIVRLTGTMAATKATAATAAKEKAGTVTPLPHTSSGTTAAVTASVKPSFHTPVTAALCEEHSPQRTPGELRLLSRHHTRVNPHTVNSEGRRNGDDGEHRDVLDSSWSAPEMPEVLLAVTPHSVTELASSFTTAATVSGTVPSHAGGGVRAGRGGQDRESLLSGFASLRQRQLQEQQLQHGGAPVPTSTSMSSSSGPSLVQLKVQEPTEGSGDNARPSEPQRYVAHCSPHTRPQAKHKVGLPSVLVLARRSAAGSTLSLPSENNAKIHEVAPGETQHSRLTKITLNAAASPPSTSSAAQPHTAAQPDPESAAEQLPLKTTGSLTVEMTTQTTTASFEPKTPRGLSSSTYNFKANAAAFMQSSLSTAPRSNEWLLAMDMQRSSSVLCDTSFASPCATMKSRSQSPPLGDSLPDCGGADALAHLSPALPHSAPPAHLERSHMVISPTEATTTAPSEFGRPIVTVSRPFLAEDNDMQYNAEAAAAGASKSIIERAF